MEKQNTDTLHLIVERILRMDVIPDVKVVLLGMFCSGKHSVSFRELEILVNAPLNELDYARTALSADRISRDKRIDYVTLNEGWLKSFMGPDNDEAYLWFKRAGGSLADHKPDTGPSPALPSDNPNLPGVSTSTSSVLRSAKNGTGGKTP
jgi:hypothetical protein